MFIMSICLYCQNTNLFVAELKKHKQQSNLKTLKISTADWPWRSEQT